jgi:hypothetical protein
VCQKAKDEEEEEQEGYRELEWPKVKDVVVLLGNESPIWVHLISSELPDYSRVELTTYMCVLTIQL